MDRNLFRLSDLSIPEITAILDRADALRAGAAPADLTGKIACDLFLESSTRTQYSFIVAQERLNMKVISFNPSGSSLNKQESFYDTVMTFSSYKPDVIVIRHGENEYWKQLVGHVCCPILSGGDGTGNHPTQSLLDLMTIREEFGKFEGLKAAIIGDIRHSRVAHTNFEVMQRLGMEVCTSGPDEYMEEGYNFRSFEEAVRTSDVVMLLRVQHERHAGGREGFSREDYHSRFGLTAERVEKMKPGAIIMHPAPVNRSVEIADDVVEHPRARIFRQMENGVYVRMAVIERAVL